MRKSLQVLCIATLTASALGAHAQSTRPGLWEINSKMGGNPEMDAAMAQNDCAKVAHYTGRIRANAQLMEQMIDGLGLAETTPGPLILVNEFVGFLAGFRDRGGAWRCKGTRF